MNYQQAIDYIHGIERFGSKPGLARTKELLKHLGSPEKSLKFVHVAGTNGKGSTSAFITGMLQEAGYRVGLYISPFLERFNERIQINRCEIPNNELAILVTQIKLICEEISKTPVGHPTQFEITTALALKYYAEQKVDIVVLEVGLGGRFDATNVIPAPEVAVITTIGFDHQAILGDTLAKIAYEKAGIIKKNSIVITGVKDNESLAVITKRVNEEEATLYAINKNFASKNREFKLQSQQFTYESLNSDLYDISISLNGIHQVDNACVAIAAVEVLQSKGYKISWQAITEGIKKVKWPGRMEVVAKKPTIILDGAHNTHGTKALAKSMRELKQNKRIITVIGILKDKDFAEMIEHIADLTDYAIITAPDYYRALNINVLAEEAKKLIKNVRAIVPVTKAIEQAKKIANEDDIILVTGSLYTIGEARSFLTKE
ncbi:bifunctional folylpolyglutamate synthase/dihydrofolate synthase [Clostridium sp. 'deep sea']|uniref:bifunctional folylpolyglutamate synthase/dihydrofolate synthase n=1 Tax=Clostridium sp. 'deep sea' TaxID=2779445 RepID=UPI0018965832|nr:folylpolyglutamate synthase/dihydrofolate synthase family protein [Clostridium sp. 'deep sea']QOR36383.1 bifunctional folylpolyglutamate synthase/dihydrofolate synthase [Clostridium sp. 'deep sea']